MADIWKIKVDPTLDEKAKARVKELGRDSLSNYIRYLVMEDLKRTRPPRFHLGQEGRICGGRSGPGRHHHGLRGTR